MAPVTSKRRRVEDEVRRPKKKVKVRRQKVYHSSSEDEGEDGDVATAANAVAQAKRRLPKSILKQSAPAVASPVQEVDADDADELELDELEKNTALNVVADQSSASDDDGGAFDDALDDLSESAEEEEENDTVDAESETTSMTSSTAARLRKKRNDPAAFATSISKILDTKLTSSKRQDPVLSRSKTAAEANKTLADGKLEQKARQQIRAEKKQALEKGRVKDVLRLDTPDVDTGAILEEEKRLKKTAQRGVVKLFNAVRAAQVKAEEGMRQARSEGVVGMQKREERVNEMSKQGFLDLISSGGKKAANVA